MKKREKGSWLNRGEIAELFAVSVSTVTRWAREGRLPTRKTPGGHYRYLADGVKRIAGATDPVELVPLD